MAWLSWITDSELEYEVKKLLDTAKNAKEKSPKKFEKNVIDPFAAIIEIAGFDISYNEWRENETQRQAQKTLQNHIGEFHQNILGYVKGWKDMKAGKIIDLRSDEQKIIAEVKNKYNTINGGGHSSLYTKFEELISLKTSIYKGYTAYYVAIIPKSAKRYNNPYTPSQNGKGEKSTTNENIREIDGASFYSLVTGSETALFDLYSVLPEVIYKCSKKKITDEEKENLFSYYKKAFEKK